MIMQKNNDLDTSGGYLSICSMDYSNHCLFDSTPSSKNRPFPFVRRNDPVHSLWDLLPKNVIDLIYSFDATFQEFMRHHVLRLRPLYMFQTLADQSSQFYASIICQRLHNSHWGDLLQILNLKSIYTGHLKFPLKYEIDKKLDYKMRLYDLNLHKFIFNYDNKIHWYICLDQPCLDIIVFLKRFLFTKHIRLLASTRIQVYRKIANVHPMASFNKSLAIGCLKIPANTIEKVIISRFQGNIHPVNVIIEKLEVLVMKDRIFVEYVPDENRQVNYPINKWKYNALVYYLNKLMKSVFL